MSVIIAYISPRACAIFAIPNGALVRILSFLPLFHFQFAFKSIQFEMITISIRNSWRKVWQNIWIVQINKIRLIQTVYCAM